VDGAAPPSLSLNCFSSNQAGFWSVQFCTEVARPRRFETKYQEWVGCRSRTVGTLRASAPCPLGRSDAQLHIPTEVAQGPQEAVSRELCDLAGQEGENAGLIHVHQFARLNLRQAARCDDLADFPHDLGAEHDASSASGKPSAWKALSVG